MAVKTFTTGEVLTSADTNTYLANSGLVYVSTTTIGTAVSSVTVSNCFSSTYEDYRIDIKDCAASTGDGLNFQIGTITSSVYYGNWSYALYTATAFNLNPMNAQPHMVMGLTNTSADLYASIDIANPFKTSVKFFKGNYYGRGYTGTFGGTASSATSQTSFKIFNGSGTLTGGTITVYGYRKA